ncbi:Gfo/Idh/MocA family protein [Tellurirhabdus bombi]|uniref:Gfo/Idh/MocA family protein n=1 Tax=Tellurirhabdus bombi TaxID=2907205 RepID=UPI001F3341D4|nr:Gfo/Idh/MocA family oxidoreductase [Tellurirhabdus bombi]
MQTDHSQSRRQFLKSSTALASFFIVPRYVLGGPGYLAPSDQISLGFIGLGRQSGGLRRNFQQTGQVRIPVACDVDRTKMVKFITDVKAAAGVTPAAGTNNTAENCKPYDDFRAVLDRSDVDGVVIVAPDHWHAAIAVRAAEAGKDIYCEKPLSLTVAEGRAMVKATRKYKRVFQTGSMQRSWKEFRQAVELVRSGAIGEVKTVKVNVGGPPEAWNLTAETLPNGLHWDMWLGPNPVDRPYNSQLAPPLGADYWARWRNIKEFGGGGMTDWGAHMFDIAQWGLDMDKSGPVSLTPPSDNSGKGLVYTYANGVKMIHEPVQGGQFCHFIGTEGEVKVGRGSLITTPASLKDKVIAESDRKIYHSENHYVDFLNAMRSRKPPVCDVEVGHRTATVCNIGNIAYELKRPLRWDPKKEKFVDDDEANKWLSRPLKKEWKV